MIRLLIDTNIIIDLLSRREEFYNEAATLFSLADKNILTLTVSSLTFANTNYILSKLKKDAHSILQKFKVLVETLSLDDKVVKLTLSDEKFSDFEDGLQYYSAIENQIDIIITRDKKDFKSSKIPVMSAKEFLASDSLIKKTLY